MKTIYTLLLAFGLCLTVHSQNNIIDLHDSSSSDMKSLVLSKLDQVSVGTSNGLVFHSNLNTMHCKSITDLNVNSNNTDLLNTDVLIVENIPSNFNNIVDISNFSNIKCVLLILNDRLSLEDIEMKYNKLQVSSATSKYYFVNLPN